jgi:hypothetical protein
VTEHARAGAVTATVSYEQHSGNAAFPYSNLHLEITRDGKVLHDAAVSNPFCGTSCYPGETNPVRVVDVNATGEPDVLLDAYSGGAHCCYVLELFRYDAASKSYTELQRDWGDPGYRLEHLEHSKRYEFVSADDRFAYEFAPYAYSGLPLQIWALGAHGFVNITRQYPALIARDAAVWLKAWRSNRSLGYGNGELAAWAADEYLLGKGSAVTRTLNSAEASGQLRSTGFGPSGRGFIKSLDHYLKRTGYIK